MSTLYFEDFHAGQIIELGSYTISEEEIITFAQQFDPQPFHIDHAAASDSIFGGLVASGWHTCALLMKVLVSGLLLRSASLGSPGVDEVRWIKPVRPGDTLSMHMKIVETIPSTSKPDRGVLRSEYETFNQHGDVVMRMKTLGMFGRRPT
ncbi:MAG: MaoC family dehydratase [Panacagrimonas sp.]